MKKAIKLLAVSMTLLFVASCAPDPADVCAHLEQVYAKKDSKPSYLRDRDTCINTFERRKKSRGVNSYRREVECLLASTKNYDIRECTKREEKRMR